jgi:hypothetical protein
VVLEKLATDVDRPSIRTLRTDCLGRFSAAIPQLSLFCRLSAGQSFQCTAAIISRRPQRNRLYSGSVTIQPAQEQETILVANRKYLRVASIPGKFYVSEGWKPVHMGGDGSRSQFEHGNQLAQMVLAGPYDTRGEAERWNTAHANGHADI